MRKCVITVVGKDTVGIIAKVCTYLAETKINILDISQTIVSGYFNMMMIVDTGAYGSPGKRKRHRGGSRIAEHSSLSGLRFPSIVMENLSLKIVRYNVFE